MSNPTKGKGLTSKKTPSVTVQNLPPVVLSGSPVESKEDLNKFVNDLYDINNLTVDELAQIQNVFEYKGFNRDRILKQLHGLNNKRVVIELIIATALRGPQAAATLKMSNGKTPPEMGIPASGQQGTDGLSLNKILSSTADLAAFYLKRMNVAKRLQMDLPAWLQFPSAGSIRLPRNLRELHLEFSKRFSKMIGGEFQEQIYGQMEANAYLDNNLQLFN